MRSALSAVGVALCLCGAACGDSRPVDTVEAAPGTIAGTTTTAVGLIDTQALLARFGFILCDGLPPAGDVAAARGQEILFAAIDAGIAGGGSPGGDGSRATISLFVLDEASLSTLAVLAEPSEVCVSGQDPNDYVAPGPQALEGPGWRWVGAGADVNLAEPFGLIADQAGYDRLWPLLGAGPETVQVPVDFEQETILTIVHRRGLSFGACGVRFDGFAVRDGTVVIDLFTPGGNQMCDAIGHSPSVFAVALDRTLTGPPPFEVAIRLGARQPPRTPQPVAADAFATTTTQPPEPEPTTTTAPPVEPSTAPDVAGTVPAGERSVHQFDRRVAESDGAFDLPLPDGWEGDAGPGRAAARITGRGALEVQSYEPDDDAWKVAVSAGSDLAVVSGPVAVGLPVYRSNGGDLVTTGEVVSAQEYRYASRGSFLQVVVRWWERDGKVVVARVGYPDPTKVAESLTGLTPDDLLDDVHLLR